MRDLGSSNVFCSSHPSSNRWLSMCHFIDSKEYFAAEGHSKPIAINNCAKYALTYAMQKYGHSSLNVMKPSRSDLDHLSEFQVSFKNLHLENFKTLIDNLKKRYAFNEYKILEYFNFEFSNYPVHLWSATRHQSILLMRVVAHDHRTILRRSTSTCRMASRR